MLLATTLTNILPHTSLCYQLKISVLASFRIRTQGVITAWVPAMVHDAFLQTNLVDDVQRSCWSNPFSGVHPSINPDCRLR